MAGDGLGRHHRRPRRLSRPARRQPWKSSSWRSTARPCCRRWSERRPTTSRGRARAWRRSASPCIKDRIAELKAGIAKGGAREAAIRALLYVGMGGAGADERSFNTLREMRAENDGHDAGGVQADRARAVLQPGAGPGRRARRHPGHAAGRRGQAHAHPARRSAAPPMPRARRRAKAPRGWRSSRSSSPPARRAATAKKARSQDGSTRHGLNAGDRAPPKLADASNEGRPCRPPFPILT